MTRPITFIGVGTPQANPTVELEFREYYGGQVAAQVTRLSSAAALPADRLREYMQQLSTVLERYDALPLAAYAFACTGSAYLLGADYEDELTAALASTYGYPIITATQAIDHELKLRKARQIAILAPYPESLGEAAARYWQLKGYDVVASGRIDVGDDTRAIYALTDADVAAALASFDTADADQLVLSGTGMPTIAALRRDDGQVLSSNFCLAVAALRAASMWQPDSVASIAKLCDTDY